MRLLLAARVPSPRGSYSVRRCCSSHRDSRSRNRRDAQPPVARHRRVNADVGASTDTSTTRRCVSDKRRRAQRPRRRRRSRRQRRPRRKRTAEADRDVGRGRARQRLSRRQDRVGELYISAYALVRYLNQLPAEQTFVDHLGQVATRSIRATTSSRTASWSTSRAGSALPKLRYQITLWTVNTTDQKAHVRGDRLSVPSRVQPLRRTQRAARHAHAAGLASVLARPRSRDGRRVLSARTSRTASGRPASRCPGLWYTGDGRQQPQRARHHGGTAHARLRVRRLGVVDADDARVRAQRRLRRLRVARGARDAIRRLRRRRAARIGSASSPRTRPRTRRSGSPTASTCSSSARSHPASRCRTRAIGCSPPTRASSIAASSCRAATSSAGSTSFDADGRIPVELDRRPGVLRAGRVLSGQAQARALRRDVVGVRRQGRRLQDRARVPRRRELVLRRTRATSASTRS